MSIEGNHGARAFDPRLALILRDALDLDPAARNAFLDAHCKGDEKLRTRLQGLLDEADRTGVPPEHRANPEDDDPLAGGKLGNFEVRERIGRGGMGVVYRGERSGDGIHQQVALKVIRGGLDFAETRQRFLRERRILARLDHPNLARFIDGGMTDDGRPWLALEYVRGEPIDRWCDARHLRVRDRVRLFLDVCAAVQHAHAHLVIHRDLKPANVLVDEQGHVRLLDFGIARLLADDGTDDATTLAGAWSALTPEFAAPEQFSGEAATSATDIYALGVLLYQLVTGVLPYVIDRRDLAATVRTIRTLPPQAIVLAPLRGDPQALQRRMDARSTSLRAWRAEVGGDLRRIIEKCLATEPVRRYAAVQALADDLERWLDGMPVKVSGDGPGYRMGKFVARHRFAVAMAGMALLAIFAGIAATTWQMRVAQNQRDHALAEVRRTEAVRDYLMLMFGEATATRDAGVVNIRDVFRSGAERLFEEFRDRPRSGREAALMLSDLFLQVGDLEGAVPLLERLLAWDGVENEPETLAHAQYNLAQLEVTRGNASRAAELLGQAQSTWASLGESNRLIVNESRLTQARIERMRGQPQIAIDTLEQALAERLHILPAGDAELAKLVNALAIALIQVGRYEEARVRAAEAHAWFERLGRSDSDGDLSALTSGCVASMMLGDPGSCLEDSERIVATTRALYGESDKLASALHNRGLVLARVERNEEALAALREARQVASGHSGDEGPIAIGSRVAMAELLARMGLVEQAEALIRSTLGVIDERYAAQPSMRAAAQRALAYLHLASGRRDEARSAMDAAVTLYAGLGPAGEAQIRLMAPLRAALPEG